METGILLMTHRLSYAEFCIFCFEIRKREVSPKWPEKKKNTAISINVQWGKDTNGLATAQGPERLCLPVPRTRSHPCTFTSLSNKRVLRATQIQQCNSKDGQKTCWHLITEFIQKTFSAMLLGVEGENNRQNRTHTHTKASVERAAAFTFTPRENYATAVGIFHKH